MQATDCYAAVPQISTVLGGSLSDARQLSQPGAGVEEHNNKFHHWHQGQDGGVAIQMEEPKLFWCLVRSSMSDLAMRQVSDGGDIVAQFIPSLLDTKVSPPSLPTALALPPLLGLFRRAGSNKAALSCPRLRLLQTGRLRASLLNIRLRLWWALSWVERSKALTHRCWLAGLVPLGAGDVRGAAVQPAAGRLLGERL